MIPHSAGLSVSALSVLIRYGTGDRQRELPEQLAGDPAHERTGNKHGQQDQGRRDHRSGDLRHRFHGRVLGLQAIGQMASRIFNNDNRIIDNNSNGQHNAKQRQHVDREPDHVHDRKRTDQRNRNCDDWNDGRAPILQKDIDHQAPPARSR